ncbi:MAG: hypothetical protein JST84_00770 [Acidobacteria bacterium]|nr:hypothetical protein [Acidobacteriota bacterium]
MVRVELDVYSGQPNPSWELAASDVAAVASRLTGLPRLTSSPAEPGLGYRGVVLLNPQGQVGLPLEIRVYNGTVTVREASGLSHYQDTKGLEEWLLAQARQRGHQKILQELGK